MDTTLITIISSFVFIVLLWIGIGVRYLKGFRRKTDGAWEFVDERVRKRHDFAPVLATCISDAGLISKMVPLRDSARRVYFPCAEKSSKEKAFSAVLGEMIAFGEKGEAVKDTNFLEIRGEILNVNADILNRSRDYNEVVAAFNKALGYGLLKPLAFILKLKNAEGF